jgi:hypothetical protein
VSYATIPDLVALLGEVDDSDIPTLTLALSSAEQLINRATWRRFDQVTETRTFDTDGTALLYVGDLVSITSITYLPVVGDAAVTLVAGTDYRLGGGDGSVTPYRWVQVIDGATYPVWRLGTATIVITGVWGWPSVPDDIRLLTCSLAVRAWRSGRSGYQRATNIPGLGTLEFAAELGPLEQMTLKNYSQAQSVVV